MRVAVSVLRANGWPRVIAALAAMRRILRSGGSAVVVAAAVSALLVESVRAETLPDALVRTYQNNPQLNAERARLRGVDEGVSQALAGYRPQLLATLTGGLQQVRVLFFDNTIQTATLRTWTVGLTAPRAPALPTGERCWRS
jgi:outer membrane protein